MPISSNVRETPVLCPYLICLGRPIQLHKSVMMLTVHDISRDNAKTRCNDNIRDKVSKMAR
jgi:hypothetical protein